MNRYSRINNKSKTKSSVPIDFSEHLSLPISQIPPIISKPHEEKCNKNDKSIHVMHGEEGDGEMFGVILKRSRTISSYKSMAEKESSSSISSMKRSFSVSSSASAAGGGGYYCRIHHQNDYPISDEETRNNVLHSRQRKKEKGKILRACMRLLGF